MTRRGAQLHEKSLVERGARIGAGTRVWAFAHVLPGATIGRDCNICDHVFIEGGVTVGHRVTVKSGVQLWAGVTIEDDAFIGPNVTFTNDAFPRSRRPPREWARTRVGRGASIGANATVLARSIGAHAMVGAGSVITQDVPPNAIVAGNPARITGYVTSGGVRRLAETASRTETGLRPLAVRGAKLVALPRVTDIRGSLTFGEFDRHLPFAPKRYFVVFDIPGRDVRGESAHRKLRQFLVCLRGSVRVMLDDGVRRDQVVLDAPDLGLYVPQGIWLAHFRHSSDALLLTLASHAYDGSDYVRDYNEFLKLARRRPSRKRA